MARLDHDGNVDESGYGDNGAAAATTLASTTDAKIPYGPNGRLLVWRMQSLWSCPIAQLSRRVLTPLFDLTN